MMNTEKSNSIALHKGYVYSMSVIVKAESDDLYIVKAESDDLYLVYSLDIPDLLGQGKTKKEALNDMRGQLETTLNHYFENGGRLPLMRSDDLLENWRTNKIEKICVRITGYHEVVN